MLSNITRHYISQRDSLSTDEALVLNCVLFELHRAARLLNVPIAEGDTLLSFEASLVKLLLNSREI